MTLKDLQKELINSVHDLSTKDKLYLILLAGAIVRSALLFTNFDTGVYQLWLQYFLEFGSLPYFDHPPVFFLVAGGLVQIFDALKGLNPYFYWNLFVLPFAAIYYYVWDRSPYLFALLAYLLLYVSFIGYLGNIYEVAVIASVLSGVVFIYLAFVVGSAVDEKIGLYASLFTAFAWWPVAYSSTLLIDMFAAVSIVAAYHTYYVLIKTESPELKYYVLATSLLALAFYTKYYALLIIPVIALYSLWNIKDVGMIMRKSVPGVIASLLFLIWAAYTDFYFLNHYAATYYRFLTPPAASSFVNFILKALTPLLLILSLLGAYKLQENKDLLLYLSLPVVVSLGFHIVQVFLLQRSHSLINLANYMLYTFPFIAVLAGIGWKKLDIRYKDIIIFLLLATLVIPLIGSSIQMEYDDRYQTPTNNLNTLSADQVQALDLSSSQTPTLHYIYSFERDIPIWSDYETRSAHFRWVNPTKFQIVALESVDYRITLKPLAPINTTLYKDEKRIGEIHLVDGQKHIYIEPDQGTSVYRFESDRAVPFITYKRNCERHPEECSEKSKDQSSKEEVDGVLYE